MNRNSMKGPLKAGGSGSKGVEARIEEIAARSSGSFVELPIMTGSASGTTPLLMMRNCRTTLPHHEQRRCARCGACHDWQLHERTAYQLRFTLASTRAI